MQSQKNNMDGLFDELLRGATKREFDEYAQSLEGEAEFSAEHEKKMDRLFADYARRERRKRAAKTAARVACVLVAAAAVSTTAIFSVGAWRMKLMNYIFDPSKPGTDIFFNDNGGTTYYDDYVRIDYVPPGFELDEENSCSNGSGVSLTFKHNEKYFYVDVAGIDTQLSIDTEQADVEKTIVKGCEGIYSSNKNVNILLWHDDYNIYQVGGNVSKAEIFNISNSIKILVEIG